MRMALLNIAKYFDVLRTPIISGFPLGFYNYTITNTKHRKA